MATTLTTSDTIAALATPQGKGGVGIIRVSGPAASRIAKSITGSELIPRHAHFCDFRSASDDLLDQGIALFFKAPASFTGEDVLELQGHGGPVIMDCLLKEVLRLGTRLARPGEFSERAYLNDKLDLAQAEAIADLIDSQSEQAARNALRSLQGDFSKQIDQMVEQLIELRLYVEAAIDFPEEEIDFLNDGKVLNHLQSIQHSLSRIFQTARQGSLLREGMSVVIAGKPNAGKSSLLNALAQRETAIVTSIEGTTRDVLREHIQIDGMPLHIIDTAGLRDSPDEVEKEGIRRAWQEIEQADHILLVLDSNEGIPDDKDFLWPETFRHHPLKQEITLVLNKCDLTSLKPGLQKHTIQNKTLISISAKQGLGIDALREHLKTQMGYQNSPDGGFSARRRHLEALEQAQQYLANGYTQLQLSGAGELLAEDLRCAQQALAEITGQFSSDDLLGRIFSSFCIGK